MITRELLKKQTQSKGLDCASSSIIGTAIKSEEKPKPKIPIKTENKAELAKKIKVEASEIHMTKRINPADANKQWRHIHPSGSPCGRRHAVRGTLRRDELPDLVSTNTMDHPYTAVVDESMLMVPPSLLGLPANTRGNPAMATTSIISNPTPQYPASTPRVTTPLLATDTVRTTRVTTSILSILQPQTHDTQIISHKVANTSRNVNSSATPEASSNASVSTPRTLEMVPSTTKTTPMTADRVIAVSTPQPILQCSQTDAMDTQSDTLQSVPTIPPDGIVSTVRQVSTPQTTENNMTLTDLPERPKPAADKAVSADRPVSTPQITESSTMPPPPPVERIKTPESNINITIDKELQTAETLLQLHEIIGSPERNVPDTEITLPDSILDTYENEDILPVDAAPLPDISKDLQTTDSPHESDNADNSSDTIEYEANPSNPSKDDTDRVVTPDHSPRGQIKFKHYGIRRNYTSPESNRKKYSCLYCEVICKSKREINDHHRKNHGAMSCVDCSKTFPTPDALQRHRYIHFSNRQLFKCEVCGETAAFESDMKRHKAKHVPTKKWFCVYPGCNKDFKRKSDLTSHAITHTGTPQQCPEIGCEYTNANPKNLKRHMKIHSDLKPLKCALCDERFKHHQQLKRHRENHK